MMLRVALLALLAVLCPAAPAPSPYSSNSSAASNSTGYGYSDYCPKYLKTNKNCYCFTKPKGGYYVKKFGPWNKNAARYDFKESILIVILVAVAIFYEVCFHQLHHQMHKLGGLYGVVKAYDITDDVHDDHGDGHGHGHGHEEIKAEPLGAYNHYTGLFNRFQGEVVILGFLAFTVWCLIQGQTFKNLGKNQFKYEPDGLSLLHMVEDVHMQLFMTMVFLFGGMIWTIHRAMHFQRNVRVAYHEIRQSAAAGSTAELTASDSAVAGAATAKDPQITPAFLEQYELQRDFFIRCAHQKVPEVSEGAFDFSRYITCSLDVILVDLTEFSLWTWLFVVILEALLIAIAVPFLDDNESTFLPPSVALQMVVFLVGVCLWIWARQQQSWGLKQAKALAEQSNKPAALDDSAPDYPKSRINDKWPMRILQACSFFITYACVKMFTSKRIYILWWGGYAGAGFNTGETVLIIFCYAALYVAQVMIQAETVICCTTVLALPPYFDTENQKLAKATADIYTATMQNDFKNAAKTLGLSKSLVEQKLKRDYMVQHKSMTDFKDIDFNRDGELSRKEWIEKYGNDDGFDVADADGDGKINKQEWYTHDVENKGVGVPSMGEEVEMSAVVPIAEEEVQGEV